MRLVSLLCAAMLSVACGVDPTTPPPATYNSYAVDVAQILCETQFRCCATRCSTGADATFDKNLARVQRLIDAGLLKFDAAAAQTCLDAQRQHNQSCDVLASMTADTTLPCSKVLVGNTAIGQPCDSQVSTITGGVSQCITTGYCNGATCTAYLNVGDSCAAGGTCIPGSYCDVAGTRTCRPLAKTGESCATIACDTTTTKLVCLASKLCGLPQDDGAMCTANNQCKNSRCVAAGTAPSTCQPPIIPAQTLRDQLCSIR